MKFGLFGGAVARRGEETADSQGYGDFIDTVIEAEQLGFESIFIVEHHFSGGGQLSSSLNLLSYLAAKTSTIRLGTAVTVLPWHNPVLIAEQAATVDLLSGGRLDFGVGKGYRDIEFHGFDIPKEEALARYEESIEVIVKSWTSDERFDHTGKYWSFNDIIVEPPTIQKPHPPLWTAAGTDQSIARVAETGMSVMLDHFASFERTEERLKAWRDACKRFDRKFDPMEVALARGVTITLSEEELEEATMIREQRVSKMFDKFGALPGLEKSLPDQPDSYANPDLAIDDAALLGTPEMIIKRIQTLKDMGFEHILFLLPDSIETLRIISKEIMPAFKD
ncbi:MAG: LLM class flavin-dependent oxidoreductase [Rhodospirillaceae bacterium]|nr:LLM class flavin-dependent oxidoreductase [Rhodospirillaceae bacterium]MBT7953628.1 LLM class flavin-dependent oxidoreductase [Rhodospirillaceae bacterium]